MEEILSKLDGIANKIGSFEKKRKKIGEKLRKTSKGNDFGVGETFVKKVLPNRLKRKTIAGVDGGLVKRSYQGLDLALIRAIAVISSYKNGKLENVKYFPSLLQSPELKVFEGLSSETELVHISNLERLRKETKVITEVLKKNCDLVLADGSILPHPSDIPRKSSSLFSKFEELLSKYRELYKVTENSNFAGVCEDSRARKFLKLIDKRRNLKSEEKKILEKSRDINLLNYILDKGERSFIFKYSENPEKSPVLRKLNEYGKNIYSFYLKTTQYDAPIRIDFYSKEDPIEKVKEISSLIFSISSGNEEYGLPTVLIEADKRARIKERELQMLHAYIQDKCGNLPNLKNLNRRRRPF